MNCTCSIEGFDTDDTEMFKDCTRTAKKDYRCCECGEIIPKGTPHNYASGKTDGVWWQYRTCLPCDDLRQCFFCSWLYTQLYEDLRNSADDINLSGLESLSPEARAKFFRRVDC